MAFKMKAGKEGPMKKNFPSVFKKDKLTELAKQGQPKGTKEALETMVKVGGNKRRRKNTYNAMMGQFDKIKKPRLIRAMDKIEKGASKVKRSIYTGVDKMLGRTKLYKGKDRSNQKIA